jgi:2-hydroxychromene-2-carboxylate isomerase
VRDGMAPVEQTAYRWRARVVTRGEVARHALTSWTKSELCKGCTPRAPMSDLEFFFDLSSPWTRLAFHNVQPILRETGASVTWRPFLVGGVFNAVNPGVYAGRAAPDDPRIRRSFVWLREWARLAGVTMNFPSPHHPVKSVLAMRVCCVLEENQLALVRFATQAFEAYFADQRNLDDAEVLVDVASACGLDGPELLEAAKADAIKQRLRARTQEVIDRGGFGSPTMFVDGALYFGNDQLPLVRQALEARMCVLGEGIEQDRRAQQRSRDAS